MTTGNPRDEADLQEFLSRDSALSGAYAAIDPVQPPEILDTKILSSAKAAVAPAGAKPAAAKPAAAKPAPATPAAARPATEPRPAPKPAAGPAPAPARTARPAAARPAPVADDEDDAPPARRPRWLVPVAAAATLLVAVGIGIAVLDGGSGSGDAADSGKSGTLGSLFAKRARERSEEDKAAAVSAEATPEAEVIEPLPPPPVFEPEGPQVEDLDKAIALIRRELVMANQTAAPAEPGAGAEEFRKLETVPDRAATLVAPPAAPAADAAPGAVIQPRERRLSKILELYDGGNPDLAAASLEIFLRDFEDDPISQRILETQPKAGDVAVE